MVRSHVILGFASARGEIVGLRSKAIAPAASTNAIPKGASPMAAGGASLRTTYSIGSSRQLTSSSPIVAVFGSRISVSASTARSFGSVIFSRGTLVT